MNPRQGEKRGDEGVGTSEILQLREQRDRARAAEHLARGGIVASGFNGIFVLLGDADDPGVAAKVAAAKGRSEAQGAALVCPPELFGEHVDLEALPQEYPFDRVQELQRELHALGVIVPAARPGTPEHVAQSGTVLNVWTEQPPDAPLRRLVEELRGHGRRALAGTSANPTGSPTITDADEVVSVFGGRVAAILLDDFDHLSPERRRSASIVDLTRPQPHLFREGSVPRAELAAELRRLRLGELVVGPNVRRV